MNELTDYESKQLVGTVFRITVVTILLDAIIGPLAGANLALWEWLAIVFAASLTAVQVGYDFGDGQTRATLVATEEYGRGE